MPFVGQDFYSSSAGTEIFNYWNPFVTKFDSQSFYNFEQDNQPLYDLEERTFELWAKATGYATSSLNGMPFAVLESLDSDNRNVFTNLQDAIDALPCVIRTPTMIEVAVSGLVGGMDLKNIDIVENGVLEIINRGFAKIYSGADSDRGGGNGVVLDSKGNAASSVGKQTTGRELKDLGLVNFVSSLDLSATISETSALSVATNVSSLFCQKYIRGFAQVINPTSDGERDDRVTCGFTDLRTGASPLSTFITNGTGATNTTYTPPQGGYGNVFFFNNYEADALTNAVVGQIEDATIATQDVSASRGAAVAAGALPFLNAGAYLSRNQSDASFRNREMTGMVYANSVSAINIENCNGPLYVRGFCVDAVSGTTVAEYVGAPWHANVGISVINSDATIENCSVMRAKTAGAKFVNSNVKLSRGFFSYRNYEMPSPGTARGKQRTAGIHAINSRIDLAIDPTYASGADYAFNTQHHTYGLLLENSVLTGGQSRPNSAMHDTALGFSYNDTGIKAVNSTIDVSGNLDVYGNYRGIELIDSNLSTDRVTIENNTFEGIKAENSTIKYNNSQIRRTYGADASGFRMTQTLFHRNGMHLDLTKNSDFTYYHDLSALAIPIKYGALRFNDSHGVASYEGQQMRGATPPEGVTASASLPAIHVNNSTADFLHPRLLCSSISMTAPGITAAVKAEDNATVNFLGTVNGASIIQGTGATTPGIVGLAADNSSKFSFRGPTVIAQFTTGAIAENNSTLEFIPHRTKNQTVDVSGYTLTDATNHTSVEIHTTGDSCLVANHGSQIVMEDLGSPMDTIYKAFAPGEMLPDRMTVASGSYVDPDYNVVNVSAFTKGGSMQFYPNPPLTAYVTNQAALDQNTFLPDTNEASDQMTAGTQGDTPYNYYLTDYFGTPATVKNIINGTGAVSVGKGISLGGFCVKIFSNSTGKVNNVNFPCGWTNSDGSYFDSSAAMGGCNQLRIWNIGGNSNLYAAHTSVCAIQPYYCSGYTGPRAIFLSGATTEAGSGIFDQGSDMTDSQIAYAAGFPSRKVSTELDLREHVGTPDTSSLSILDWFGFGIGPVKAGLFSEEITSIQESLTGSGGTFGKLQAQNLGPFRLFFDVDPCMRFVGYPSGPGGEFIVADTKPYQHLAQGYSLSGPAGINPAHGVVSGLYPKLCQPTGKLTAANTANPPGQRASWRLEPSGYYYGSAMLGEHDPGSHVYLDENAANTFANAKNCSMPAFSGRAAPRVSIYRSTTGVFGGLGSPGMKDLAAANPYPFGTMRAVEFFDPRRIL